MVFGIRVERRDGGVFSTTGVVSTSLRALRHGRTFVGQANQSLIGQYRPKREHPPTAGSFWVDSPLGMREREHGVFSTP